MRKMIMASDGQGRSPQTSFADLHPHPSFGFSWTPRASSPCLPSYVSHCISILCPNFYFPLNFGARTVSHLFELPTTASDTQATMGIYCKMEEKAGRGRWAVGSGAPWGIPAELAVGSAVGEGGRHQRPCSCSSSPQGF